MNRKFSVNDRARVITGFYAGVETTITGCYYDQLHGNLPYVTVDFCEAAFYEDALEPISAPRQGDLRAESEKL